MAQGFQFITQVGRTLICNSQSDMELSISQQPRKPKVISFQRPAPAPTSTYWAPPSKSLMVSQAVPLHGKQALKT